MLVICVLKSVRFKLILKHKMYIYHCIVQILLSVGQTSRTELAFPDCCATGTDLLEGKGSRCACSSMGSQGFGLHTCPCETLIVRLPKPKFSGSSALICTWKYLKLFLQMHCCL